MCELLENFCTKNFSEFSFYIYIIKRNNDSVQIYNMTRNIRYEFNIVNESTESLM